MTEPGAIIIAALITTVGGIAGTVLGHLLTKKDRVTRADRSASLPPASSSTASSSLPGGGARVSPGILHWTEATILGLMLGATISWLGRSLFDADLARGAFVTCAGFVAALPQWLVLRPAVRYASLWPACSAFLVPAMQILIFSLAPEGSAVFRLDIFAGWIPWIAASLSLRLLAHQRGL